MTLANFQINQRSFSSALNPAAGLNQFEIKSVPRPYSVILDDGEQSWDRVAQLMKENKNNLLLVDEKVFGLYCRDMALDESKVFKAAANEEFKTVDGMLKVVGFMNRNQITKGDKLIVVGGGIVQDVGAFAAATYKRGIPWVYFPTTFLSQSDSCIGGKTGLNHEGAKNQLALFSAPTQVVINPSFLKTLSTAELQSGLGEVLKLHVTGGRDFLDNYIRLQKLNRGQLDFAVARELILGALSVKKVVVEEDEFELDLRRSMNYGHTFGHAVEILSNYEIPHGQAVTIGMLLANELSSRRGLLPHSQRDEIRDLALDLLDPSILKIMKTIPVDGLFSLLKKDKKTVGTKVNFIVLHRIGDMRVLPIELNDDLTAEVTQIIREIFN